MAAMALPGCVGGTAATGHRIRTAASTLMHIHGTETTALTEPRTTRPFTFTLMMTTTTIITHQFKCSPRVSDRQICQRLTKIRVGAFIHNDMRRRNVCVFIHLAAFRFFVVIVRDVSGKSVHIETPVSAVFQSLTVRK
jgi:hypothetical protein